MRRKPGWKTDWEKYHAETRANFWSRIYCGMIATGTDTLSDFRCVCHQEKGYCVHPYCGFNLGDYRRQIQDRTKKSNQ